VLDDGKPNNVRISPSAVGHFACFCRLTPYSAKTYGNPARGIVCRNTDDFPGPVTVSFIGPFLARPRKGMRLPESGRRDDQIRLPREE
jgi:hypothetical protein